jgi:hypothetical protein
MSAVRRRTAWALRAGFTVFIAVAVTATVAPARAGALEPTLPGNRPTITGLSPDSGVSVGGTLVTITGTNLSSVRFVRFGKTSGYSNVSPVSSTELTVVSPAHPVGNASVQAIRDIGPPSQASLASQYRYVATPVSGLTVPGMTASSIALGWNDPTAAGFTGVIIRRSAGSIAPPTAHDGKLVATLDTHATSYDDTAALRPGTTYSYSVFAEEGNARAAAVSTTAATLSWGAPAPVDPRHGDPTAVSCPSAVFCEMVDAAGSAFTYQSGSWSGPVKVDPSTPLRAISCPTAQFCAAVGDDGIVAIDQAGVWAASTVGTADITAVSCRGGKFCIAVDVDGEALTFTGAGGWAVATIDPGQKLLGVSCSSTTHCVATDGSGHALTWSGASWGAPVSVANDSLRSVTCPSDTFCLAAGAGGFVYRDESGNWGTSTEFGQPALISCRTLGFCLGLDGFDDSGVFNGSKWRTPRVAHSVDGWRTLSCGSPKFCLALSGTRAGVFSTGSWHVGAGPDQADAIETVDCADTDYCEYVTTTGRSGSFHTATGWAPPADNGAEEATTAISCPTASFCAGVSRSDEEVLAGGAWTATPSGPVQNTLIAVSCASATFCGAGDTAGRFAMFNGTKWSPPAAADDNGLTSLSCTGPSFCAAVDSDGLLLTFDGTTWSPRSFADVFNTPVAVDCWAAGSCVAVDHGGDAVFFNSGTWSAPVAITNLRLDNVSCLPSGYCYASAQGKVYGFAQDMAAVGNSVGAAGKIQHLSCVAGPVCTVLDESSNLIRGS